MLGLADPEEGWGGGGLGFGTTFFRKLKITYISVENWTEIGYFFYSGPPF